MMFQHGIVVLRAMVPGQPKPSEPTTGTCATASKISADADARMVA